MLNISLTDIGKRYKRNWIFKHISQEFSTPQNIAITGSNGSGKSTLLKLIAGTELPTNGSLNYTKDNKELDLNHLNKFISIVTPYMDLPEQLTLSELFQFQSRFKPFRNNINLQDFLTISYLKDQADELVKDFSSGIKQRLKLSLSILSSAEVIFLDEPCSNLDQNGINYYKDLIKNHSKQQLLFIASNDAENELINCDQELNVLNYKD